MKVYVYNISPLEKLIDLQHLPAVMYEGEDLCVSDDERKLRDMLGWLNSEDAPYYLRAANPYLRIIKEGGGDDFLKDKSSRDTTLLIVIFDHAKAALFQIVFDVPEPEIVDFYWTAADEAEAEREKQKAAREELEARLLAEAEAARRAREYRPPVITEAAPAVHKPLMERFMDGLRKMGEFR